MLQANSEKANAMICLDCGVAMNHHADKVDYTMALSKPESIDPELGGILQEAHTCPECGQTALCKALNQGVVNK